MYAKTRILAVDDCRVNMAIMEEVFGQDYDLATTSSGEDAIEIAPHWCPELILLDIDMPGIDGYETCRRLRTMPSTEGAKIVLVSGHGRLEDRLRGYEAGADDFVVKPFDAEELRAKARVLLRLHAIEVVDRLKSRFLDLLAHETRTPLSGIIGPAQLIAEDTSGDVESMREFGQLIVDSARHLQNVVDRSLLLCSFRVGENDLHLMDFDLAGTLRSVVENAHHFFPIERGEIDFECPETLPWRGDPSHLAMVMESMLHNAIEYRTPGSTVVCHLVASDTEVEIRVENEGPGIEEEALPHLFAGFDVADLDHHGGHLGLSLSLSREIVLEHSGTIDVDSEPGATTRFVVRLPRLPHPVDTEAEPSSDPLLPTV